MSDTERVVFALLSFRKGRQTTPLPDRLKPLLAARQYLMGVSLMADIPYDPILRRVVQVVKCNGQFNRAQPGREMSTALADRFQ